MQSFSSIYPEDFEEDKYTLHILPKDSPRKLSKHTNSFHIYQDPQAHAALNKWTCRRCTSGNNNDKSGCGMFGEPSGHVQRNYWNNLFPLDDDNGICVWGLLPLYHLYEF